MPPIASPTEDVIASCSFCGKPNTAVRKLVAGPGVYICNECVELSASIVEDASPDHVRGVFPEAIPVLRPSDRRDPPNASGLGKHRGPDRSRVGELDQPFEGARDRLANDRRCDGHERRRRPQTL